MMSGRRPARGARRPAGGPGRPSVRGRSTMLRMRWTGVGFVTPLLLLLTIFVAVLTAVRVGEGVGARFAVAAVFLAGAALHRAFAWAVNSEVTPEGRIWHELHTYGGVPGE